MNKLTNIFILCIALCISACTTFFEKEQGNCIGIVVDLSDTFPEITNSLTIENLKPLFTVDKNLNSSAKFIIAKVSDIRHTETSIVTIEGETAVNANILDRKKLRNTFYSRVEQNIQHIKQNPIGTKGSFVVYAINKMLQQIVMCNSCQGKRVLIFSDLAENTTVFSVYNKAHLKLIQTLPDSVYSILDREYPMQSLNGIDIVFIHSPHTKAKDEDFHIISSFFKGYYESHGATVLITASIPKE